MCDNKGNAHMDDAFTAAVLKSFELGKRLKTIPLFKHANIRKYKRLAENLNCDAEYTVESTEKFTDQSIVGHFGAGSAAYEFYHSWPARVVLESDGKHLGWQLVVKSQHCPFCKPSARCTTLKDLLDHLDSHHQDFSYRPKRNPDNSAVIVMKLRDNRWIYTDLMFQVSTEGYMLSSRMRMKFPNYVPKAKGRGDLNYPFTVKSCTPPESYECIVAKKPRNVNTSIGWDMDVETTVGGTTEQRNVVGTKVRDVKISSTVRSKLRNLKPSSGCRRTRDTGGKVSGKLGCTRPANRVRSPGIRNSASDGPTTGKRKALMVLNGMENEHTVHLRNTMFGDKAHVQRAGEGTTPLLSREAAQGRLFHTVHNIPLDSGRFNDGFNSDVDDETDWRLRYHDEHISSFSDVQAVEKYYLSLWNSFVMTRESTSKSERGTQLMYNEFLEKCGGEIRRMKLEVPFSQQVALSWEYGALDANGFMQTMQKFRDIKASALYKLPTGFALPQCLMREGRHPYKEVHTYSGPEKRTNSSIRYPNVRRWLSNEADRIACMRKTATLVKEAQLYATAWMADMQSDMATIMESPSKSSPREQIEKTNRLSPGDNGNCGYNGGGGGGGGDVDNDDHSNDGDGDDGDDEEDEEVDNGDDDDDDDAYVKGWFNKHLS